MATSSPLSTPHEADETSAERSHPPSVRAQRAVVRSLAHTLEQLMAAGIAADGVRQQLIEEIDRFRVLQTEATR